MPKAGETVRLLFKVFHPGTGEPVEEFEIVHDQPYHLFVISQDLEHFEHIHPLRGPDGSWSIDVVLPRPGYYRVISDFVPRGGTAQLIARPLVTAAYDGDLAADGARLVPDASPSKTVDGLTATLTYDPPTFVAGLYGHLSYYLTDASTALAVIDLQPYLGAFGHTLIVSEDLVDYVHSHPIDLTTPYDEGSGPKLFMLPMHAGHSGHEEFRGGPEVTFDGLMPRAGPLPRIHTVSLAGRDPHVRVHVRRCGRDPRGRRGQSMRTALACSLLGIACAYSRIALPHAATSNTVLFDREIVRILNDHCVMCHAEGGPSFPLSTYEQTWLARAAIHREVLEHRMPPWAAVPGYGKFANANTLTLREMRFIVSWVEGLGPRNAGTVFLNVLDSDAAHAEIDARIDFAAWQLGAPDSTVALPAAARAPTVESHLRVQRVVVDLGLDSERRLRALEYRPADRTALHAAVFTLEKTGQWLATWTPWHGYRELPEDVAFRLPAGARIVADIYTAADLPAAAERGELGLYFESTGARREPSRRRARSIRSRASRRATPAPARRGRACAGPGSVGALAGASHRHGVARGLGRSPRR